MRAPSEFCIRQLGGDNLAAFRGLLAMFGEAFGERETYAAAQPDDAYLARLLAGESFIAVAAMQGAQVVGGLAAYELKKFEQARSEIYIYDLAVAAPHRRKGLAAALVEKLGEIAHARGAYVMFVQADSGDDAAVALYSKLGTREHVLHFDIAPKPRGGK